jgi:hypothetical protein
MHEPAEYSEGVAVEPEYPMSVNIYMVGVNGCDIYDILSKYIIADIETEILMDLQK